jgi:hypothetical protein
MLFFALTALLFSAAAADHNEVVLGSALEFSMPKDTSTCALKLNVPSSVVKTGCKLRIRYDVAGGEIRQPTVSFFLKKGVSSFDRRSIIADRHVTNFQQISQKKKKKKKKKQFLFFVFFFLQIRFRTKLTPFFFLFLSFRAMVFSPILTRSP